MSRLTINSNLPSINAQRSLANATKKLGDSFTRLSSGLRINKASDDAAGLSISESLKSDTRLFNQGIRNLNDGVSVLAIADGALRELSNIVIRLNELAEQAATGTLGNKQRLALDQEAQSLSKEYNRIARSTEFNGRKIFNGDYGDLSLAAGGGQETLIVEDLGGAVGDGSFKEQQLLATSSSSYSVTYGDFNKDGHLDLVSADTVSGIIDILISNGNGTFKARSSIIAGSGARGLETVDLNNDGLLDILSTDYDSSSVSIYMGNIDGTFKNRISYTAGSNPYQARASDFNSDGLIDIVTVDQVSNSISIFIANSNGSFKSRVSYSSTAILPASIIAKDFNNDGKKDLAILGVSNNLVNIFLGNDNGSFLSPIEHIVDSAGYSIISEDINKDGNLDLISSGSAFTVSFGNGDGTFRSKISHTGVGSFLIASGDFNGDGNIDIASVASSALQIYIGNAEGSFKSSTSYLTVGVTASLAVIDLNNDGVIDIAASNFGNGSLSLLLGNSTSGVSALQSFSLRTQQDAKDSMSYLRKTLERIGQQRGHIGAFQSRVEFATNNLQTSALSYQEANSRITDIDVAEESSRLAATQILQQSAASILAQANQQPRLVLSLLGDL